MSEVVYRGDWPKDVRATVETVLTPLFRLIPGWCRALYVRFEASSEDRDHCATITMSYDARFATMRIAPDWLEESDDDRLRALIHEIVHLHVQPMRTVFVDLCSNMIEDQGVKDFAWERFKEAWEGSTEDLAWALHALMEAKPLPLVEL